MNALLVTVLCFTLIIYSFISQRLWGVFKNAQNERSVGTWPLHLPVILPIFVMGFYNIPLPLLYILIYAMGCLAPIRLETKKREGILLTNVCFLIFAAQHLIILGLLALGMQTDVKSVLRDASGRLLSFVIVSVLSSVITFALTSYLSKVQLYLKNGDLQELQFFSRFTWFCVCCVVLDSIPCLFPLPTKFSNIYMIGSNALLLLMFFLFASHVCAIMRDAHLREEYLQLQEEEIRQYSRTAQLENDAYLDGLTSTYTRAYVMTNLNNMLKNGESFILAFLDLDGLRNINNKQGHTAGDRYLQAFAANVREKLQPNNIFARFGGDEFLILLPDCSIEAANRQLTHIQSAVSKSGFPFSFGLSQPRSEDAKSVEEWIAKADQSMYEDKKYRKVHKEDVR